MRTPSGWNKHSSWTMRIKGFELFSCYETNIQGLPWVVDGANWPIRSCLSFCVFLLEAAAVSSQGEDIKPESPLKAPLLLAPLINSWLQRAAEFLHNSGFPPVGGVKGECRGEGAVMAAINSAKPKHKVFPPSASSRNQRLSSFCFNPETCFICVGNKVQTCSGMEKWV